jgi:hypothetical protein
VPTSDHWHSELKQPVQKGVGRPVCLSVCLSVCPGRSPWSWGDGVTDGDGCAAVRVGRHRAHPRSARRRPPPVSGGVLGSGGLSTEARPRPQPPPVGAARVSVGRGVLAHARAKQHGGRWPASVRWEGPRPPHFWPSGRTAHLPVHAIDLHAQHPAQQDHELALTGCALLADGIAPC